LTRGHTPIYPSYPQILGQSWSPSNTKLPQTRQPIFSRRFVSNVRQHRSECGSITLQLVGDDPQWFFAFASQQPLKESLGCPLIPTRLKQNVDDVAILIHGAPKVLLLAVDSYEKFIHMPAIAETPLPLPKTTNIVSPKLLTVLPPSTVGLLTVTR
jgi:hypothetical protein